MGDFLSIVFKNPGLGVVVFGEVAWKSLLCFKIVSHWSVGRASFGIG